MAINLSRISRVPYIGSPYAMPVALCTPMSQAPRSVPISIDWALYGAQAGESLGIEINLLAQQVQTPLDQIRSVYIDNTFSVSPIYVFFPDTLYTVFAPPGAIVLAPVFTNVFNFIVYCENFVQAQFPNTVIHMSNVDRQGLFIPYSPEGFSTPVTINFQQTNSGGAAPGPINFGAVPIGTADASRLVVVCGYVGRGVAPATITGCTIGGNAATLIAQSTNLVPNTTLTFHSVIYALPVPAGTTAGVIFSTSTNVTQYGMAAYTILNATNFTPLDSDAVGSNAYAGRNISSDFVANSVGVYFTNSATGAVFSNASPSAVIAGNARTAVHFSTITELRNVGISSALNLLGATWA